MFEFFNARNTAIKLYQVWRDVLFGADVWP